MCIEPQMEAAKRGHSQNLWLFGEEGYITEVGAMNVLHSRMPMALKNW